MTKTRSIVTYCFYPLTHLNGSLISLIVFYPLTYFSGRLMGLITVILSLTSMGVVEWKLKSRESYYITKEGSF